MSRNAGMIVGVIATLILVGIVSFILLAKFYPPLKLYLFGGETQISSNDIQFWVKKVQNRNYYKVYARYLKCPLKLSDHAILFRDEEKIGGLTVLFNPEDNKIYGGGWAKGTKREWEFYHLGEGEIKNGIFKTKSEVIRAGIMKLGNEYDPLIVKPITDKRALKKIKQIEKDIKSGKIKTIGEKEILKKYGYLLKEGK